MNSSPECPDSWPHYALEPCGDWENAWRPVLSTGFEQAVRVRGSNTDVDSSSWVDIYGDPNCLCWDVDIGGVNPPVLIDALHDRPRALQCMLYTPLVITVVHIPLLLLALPDVTIPGIVTFWSKVWRNISL